MKKTPGPLAPPDRRRPSLNMTDRSYSCKKAKQAKHAKTDVLPAQLSQQKRGIMAVRLQQVTMNQESESLQIYLDLLRNHNLNI